VTKRQGSTGKRSYDFSSEETPYLLKKNQKTRKGEAVGHQGRGNLCLGGRSRKIGSRQGKKEVAKKCSIVGEERGVFDPDRVGPLLGKKTFSP